MPDLRRLVRTYYETYGRHDIEGLLAMMDDDVRIYFPVDEKPLPLGHRELRPATRHRYQHHPGDVPRRECVNQATARGAFRGRVRLPVGISRDGRKVQEYGREVQEY
jgi:hypothetical protein